MEGEINDDEILSDSDSNFTTRPSTAESLDMPKKNFSSSRKSTVDFLYRPTSPTKKLRDEKPIKVLIFNGKCSNVFKSTLEECVEDCILEFPYENNSIYVPKSGPSIPIPIGSNRQSVASLRESSNSGRQTSSRRRNSITQPTVNIRNNSTNIFTLPTAALAVSTPIRMRHHHVQRRFTLENDYISEESTERQTVIEQVPITNNFENDEQSNRPSVMLDERMSPNITTFSLPLFPSVKTPLPYQEHQKDYRLSDLVMYGPEYFSHVFNLPPSSPRRRNSKTKEKLTELDRIKQDLFHRYLWTKNPQVSSRIRPLSTYTRSSTFVI